MFLPNNNVNIAVYELNPNASKTIVLIYGWSLAKSSCKFAIVSPLQAIYFYS